MNDVSQSQMTSENLFEDRKKEIHKGFWITAVNGSNLNRKTASDSRPQKLLVLARKVIRKNATVVGNNDDAIRLCRFFLESDMKHVQLDT